MIDRQHTHAGIRSGNVMANDNIVTSRKQVFMCENHTFWIASGSRRIHQQTSCLGRRHMTRHGFRLRVRRPHGTSCGIERDQGDGLIDATDRLFNERAVIIRNKNDRDA